MPSIGGYRWIGNGIGYSVVHRRETSRSWVPQVADLHGCGTSREDRQPVGCRVSREVNKDVDPIGADQLDQCLVGQSPDIPPIVGVCAKALGYRVLKVKIVVEHVRKCASVAGAHDGFKEMRDGMRP